MNELADFVHKEIQKLCANGDKLANNRNYSEALPVLDRVGHVA